MSRGYPKRKSLKTLTRTIKGQSSKILKANGGVEYPVNKTDKHYSYTIQENEKSRNTPYVKQYTKEVIDGVETGKLIVANPIGIIGYDAGVTLRDHQRGNHLKHKNDVPQVTKRKTIQDSDGNVTTKPRRIIHHNKLAIDRARMDNRRIIK